MGKLRWFVYVLRCFDESLYTGIALNVAKRITVHSSGKGSRYLRGKFPLTLAYRETCPDRSSALKREAEIKRLTRAQKEALILKKGKKYV